MKKLVDTGNLNYTKYEALCILLDLPVGQGVPSYIIIESIEEA